MVFFRSCFRARTGSDRSQDAGWRLFSLKELQNATNNFNYDNKLGEGSFGSVYWGQLWDGSQIAVKRLKVWSSKPEIDFAVEVEILGRVRHKHLLSLRGYCAEGKERLLVYNYMPNLSLSAHLHGHLAAESHLDWDKRMKIAIGCAEALAYLHHFGTPHVIHGDLKSTNLLLNSELEPQLADFGFSKLAPESQQRVGGGSKATRGYLAPELATNESSRASEKSDVYSFGILLLELISGRRPSLDSTKQPPEVDQRQQSTNTIVEWATPIIFHGKLDEAVDPSLHGRFNEVELKQVVQVAQWCSQTSPENRPTMIKVVELLKKVSELEAEFPAS